MGENKKNGSELSIINSSFKSVAIVIPMYNEVDNIPVLSYKLKSIYKIISESMEVFLVCVDDGSKDLTYQEMTSQFASLDNFHMLRHPQNRGFSAALRTGIEHALDLGTDLILTIDADTNYDHFYIPLFINSMTNEYDIITASPWHPDGNRKYFPRHRLILSLAMSAMYRYVLRSFGQPLYTYSSCFRIAKSDLYRAIRWNGKDFMATTEILVRCIINGFRVKEIPFQVNPRWFGMSKMRKRRQIKQHLKFMWELWRNPEDMRIDQGAGIRVLKGEM